MVAAYGLIVLIGGIVLMGHESVQTRYSIKEIGPRIPVAFVASALSLFFVDKLIQLANAFTQAVLGEGIDPPSLGNTLKDAVAGFETGGLFIILTGLVLVVLGFGLLIVYVVRIVITLILIISGPLFLMCHGLPHTDPLARWWWKATGAVVLIQVAQALVLITAVRTFLSGGVHLFGSTLSALGTLVGGIALFYILFKIPFWLLSAVRVSSGRSLLGGLVRAYIFARTFGMVTGHSRSGRRPGATGRSGGASSAPGPAQPGPTPTPPTLGQRLQQAAAAQRMATARRSRWPSHAPRFMQPQPQQSTHNAAVTPPNPQQPTPPTFSSAPTSATAQPSSTSRPAAPQFRPPTSQTSTLPTGPPIRTPPVPPHLRFQASTPSSEHLSRPVRPATPQPPTAPTFRESDPPPRFGDARRRTPSVPPTAFRTPTFRPPSGGDQS